MGYDITTKMRIGYIGRGGLSSTKPPEDEQFPVDGRRMSTRNSFTGATMLPPYYYNGYADSRELQYLLADDGLWVVNLKKRAAEVVHKGSDLIAGGRSELPSGKSPGTRAEPRPPAAILLRTPDRVIVLAADGKQIGTYPLPPTLRQFAITWVPLPGKRALINEFRSGYELFWFDSRGEIVRHRHVDLRDQRQSEALENAMVSTVIPSLAPIATFVFCYPWAPSGGPESLPYSAALAGVLAKVWPVFLATGIVGLLAACACYRRQRKWGLPYTAMWTAFVFLFGLPAYVGYLASRGWPARLPCPHCGRRVPRDRPACFACGREFPAPAQRASKCSRDSSPGCAAGATMDRKARGEPFACRRSAWRGASLFRFSTPFHFRQVFGLPKSQRRADTLIKQAVFRCSGCPGHACRAPAGISRRKHAHD